MQAAIYNSTYSIQGTSLQWIFNALRSRMAAILAIEKQVCTEEFAVCALDHYYRSVLQAKLLEFIREIYGLQEAKAAHDKAFTHDHFKITPRFLQLPQSPLKDKVILHTLLKGQHCIVAACRSFHRLILLDGMPDINAVCLQILTEEEQILQEMQAIDRLFIKDILPA